MTSLAGASKIFHEYLPIGGSESSVSFALPGSSGQPSSQFTQDATISAPKIPAFPRRITTQRDTAVQGKDSSAAPTYEKPERATSQLLAEWRGQVSAIFDDAFSAELKGRHGEGVIGSEEEALIPLDDVRSDDRDLVRPGAFFSLCVCYESSVDGQRRRFTDVVFRRLPAYRLEELELARDRARELVRGLRLE